jgi:hypothetical protein
MANYQYSGTFCADGSTIEFVAIDGLLTGKTYQDYELNCFTITEIIDPTQNDITKTFLYGPFNSCSACTSPISAGTESLICIVECGVSGISGDTVSISPPHPTYLNGFGKSVIQLNAVEIGGTNGLNS